MQKGITGSHYKFDRKTESVTIRVTPNELKIIRHKASLSSMSVSEYVIDCAIKKRVAGYDPADVDLDIPGQLSINDIDRDGKNPGQNGKK